MSKRPDVGRQAGTLVKLIARSAGKPQVAVSFDAWWKRSEQQSAATAGGLPGCAQQFSVARFQRTDALPSPSLDRGPSFV
jgi:hypothetical protein